MTFHLLVTASDPGAAAHLSVVIKKAVSDARFKITVLAASPAFALFEKANIKATYIDAPRIFDATSDEAKRFKKKIEKQLTWIDYNGVLTGTSGPGFGLDEVVVELSKKPTYTYQDFWGDVNIGFGRTADYFFVIDAWAKKLTEHHFCKRAIVVGAPKYSEYSHLAFDKLQKIFFKNYPAFQSKKIVVFYGQPLWQFEAYMEMINDFATYYDIDNAVLFYRPHPKETLEEIEKTKNIFCHHNKDILMDENLSLDTLLVVNDVAVSFSSTVATDLNYLNLYSNKPLGVALFLHTNEKIKALFLALTRSKEMPHVSLGLAVNAVDKKSLSVLIDKAINDKKKYWEKTKSIMQYPDKAAENILDYIYNLNSVTGDI